MSINEIITFWIISVIFSGAGSIVCALATLKEAADSGYKFILDEGILNKLSTRENEIKRRMQIFLPLYNILSQFYNLITIKSNAGLLVAQFHTLGLLEDMTPEEKREYDNNPGGIKAVKICIDSKIKEMKNKPLTKEEEEKIDNDIAGFKENLQKCDLNKDQNLRINGFEIHFMVVEEDGKRKIKYTNYKGDLSKVTDEDLDYLFLLCFLDVASTLEYYEKLRNERDELRSKKDTKKVSIKQKYVNLREEVLSTKESFEEKKSDETKLMRK